MKNFILIFSIILLVFSQKNITNLKQIRMKSDKQLELFTLFSDSLSSSYIIFIQAEVKAHIHKEHTELVHILEGTADFRLGKESLKVKAGDFIAIPKNTIHAVKVTSKNALKVLSIQTPKFYGKDRYYID